MTNLAVDDGYRLLPEIPRVSTQGIKYAGSKLKLIPHILEMSRRVSAKTVLDGFSGTTRVSQAFAKMNYNVTCADISVWSEVLGRCYLNGRHASGYRELIRHLNNCKPVDGWFTHHYGAQATPGAAQSMGADRCAVTRYPGVAGHALPFGAMADNVTPNNAQPCGTSPGAAGHRETGPEATGTRPPIGPGDDVASGGAARNAVIPNHCQELGHCNKFQKSPWQIHNTMKLDGIRQEIERLSLDPVDEAVALTSLLLALDKVDSTIGHFVSYLKEWSARSYNHLHLAVPEIVSGDGSHEVIRGDIFDTVEGREFDVAYLDPPYGSNNEKMPPSRVRYASYYHLWTTVCLNDRPDVFGAARRREDSRDVVASSVFEEFRRDDDGEYLAVKAIGRLLERVNAKYIVLSYSSGGRATAIELHNAIRKVGRLVEVREIDYRRNVMANMKWTDEWINDVKSRNTEYLFLIAKR